MLFIFEKISIRYLSVVLSSKNGIPGQEWLVQPVTQPHKCFSSRQQLCFGMQWKCFMCTFHFITQNIKKMYIQLSRFSKMGYFYYLIKGIPKSSRLLKKKYKCKAKAAKNAMNSRGVWCHCINWYKDTSSFTHHCFCSVITNFNTVKKKKKGK